jgi:hypothetical protein
MGPAPGLTTERKTPMTRSHLLAAALLAGLAVPARAAEPDKLLPAGTDTVAIINVKQVLGSEIVKKYALEQIKQAIEGQDVKQLLTDLGLDPLKDIEKVVIASVDTKIGVQADPKLAFIAHGKFDADKMYKTAEAESKKKPDHISVIKEGAATLIKLQQSGGQTAVYATVVDNKTLFASNDKKAVGEVAGGATPAPVKKELADLIRKADEKDSVFTASLLKGKLKDFKLPGGGNLPVKLDDFEKALPNVETVTMSLRVDADVLAEVVIGMTDAAAATDMQKALDDLLKQLKPLAQLAGAAEPRAKPLTDILASVKVATKSKDVTLTGKVTGANIGQIINPNGS